MILSAEPVERKRVERLQILFVDVHRCDVAERVEELHLRPRPRGLVAAILVGQQVDVVAIGVGGLREPMEALVDVADERVDLTVARSGGSGGQCCIERLVQLAGRGQRSGQTKTRARRARRPLDARSVLALGFIEETGGPQRVGVQRQRLGIVARQLASSSASCRARTNSATFSAVRTVPLRPATATRASSLLVGLGEGHERFLVPRLVVEESAELKLQISIAADVRVQRK